MDKKIYLPQTMATQAANKTIDLIRKLPGLNFFDFGCTEIIFVNFINFLFLN